MTDNNLPSIEYSPISHNQDFTLSGRQVIQSFKRQTGQPMTLDCRWIAKSILDDLNAIQDDNIMLLTLPDDRQFNVIFDRKTQHIEAEPVDNPRNDPAATELYQVTINLITV